MGWAKMYIVELIIGWWQTFGWISSNWSLVFGTIQLNMNMGLRKVSVCDTILSSVSKYVVVQESWQLTPKKSVGTISFQTCGYPWTSIIFTGFFLHQFLIGWYLKKIWATWNWDIVVNFGVLDTPKSTWDPYLKYNCEFMGPGEPTTFQSNATADMSRTHQILPWTPYFLIFCKFRGPNGLWSLML